MAAVVYEIFYLFKILTMTFIVNINEYARKKQVSYLKRMINLYQLKYK